MSPEEFKALVARSQSIKQMLEFFGLPTAGNSYKTLIKRAKADEIDLSTLPSLQPGGRVRLMQVGQKRARPLAELLVANSTRDNTYLKKRMVAEGILENRCSICGLGTEWNSKPLSLRLDHVNGVNNDNRRSNLRMVCPNCDSQLDTYCGRNRVKNRRTIKNCMDCGKRLSKHAGLRCRTCNIRQQPKAFKIEWPSDDELVAMVSKKNNSQVSKALGVSETAIRKRLKGLGITPRPYARTPSL
jgi:hypothetical protein